MTWYIAALKKYAVFAGRAQRKEYWLFVLFTIVFGVGAIVLDNITGLAFEGLGVGVFYVLFVLVSAMNPCPCGYFGDDRKECTCGLGNVQRYQSRISGPLMDRIDIHVDVVQVPFEKLASLDGGETSAVIRVRVEVARKIQAARFAPVDKPYALVNGNMGSAVVQQFCDIDEAGKNLMRMAVCQMDLNAHVSPGVEAGAHDG